MKKIELDAEVADQITLITLKSHLKMVKKDIKHLRLRKKLKQYEKEDLEYNLRLLESLTVVLSYFGED